MLGESLENQGYEGGLWPRQNLVGVKAPVFSMGKLVGVDWFLGPEMKSTGEVLGLDQDFSKALAKALIASDLGLKSGIGVLLSIADQHKPEALSIIRELHQAGCALYATEGTAALIESTGIPVTTVTKLIGEGHPDVLDIISDGTVSAVVNTLSGDTSVLRDGFYIRRAAVERRIPCFTSLDTVRAAVESLMIQNANFNIQTVREYVSNTT